MRMVDKVKAAMIKTDASYEELARAAIKAMREPTAYMVSAGMKMQDCGSPAYSGWQAMIDAALNEE